MRTVAVVLALALTPLARAVPLDVQHQGRLLGPSGAPIEGEHSVQVALYNVATGGVARYTQTTTSTFADGYFNVVLSGVDADDVAGSAVYLGLALDGGAELTPRTRLASVPFALVAQSVDGGPVRPGGPGTCDAPREGTLAFDPADRRLKICYGSAWRVVWRPAAGTQDNPGVSCKTILAETPGSPSGLYWIDPLATGTGYQVECDMETNGGGWTFIANISDAGTDVWSQFNPTQDTGIWQDTNLLGTAPSHTADYKSRAYLDLVVTDLLISHDDAPARKVLYANGCFTAQTFRAFIASLTWRAAGSDSNWTDASGAHRCNYVNLGYNDPILRALGSSELGFKWGEADGQQDGNKDRVMITGNNSNASNHHVDSPTGLGGFTARGSLISEDVNECNGDAPNDCANGNQNYGLWVR
jgi:hypothetical protein